MPSGAGRRPTLVFLHGVGTGDPEGAWRAALSTTLERVGFAGLDGVRVIAPRYSHALRGVDETEPLPPLIVKAPAGDAGRENRREFERRIGAVEFRLGRQDRGDGQPAGATLAEFALKLAPFEQARNYLCDPAIRATVLNRILDKLPDDGEIVLVAHSLGSVIAADLLRRLPVSLRVAGMVTIGSPLAAEVFGVDKLRVSLVDPPTNLAWWVSFWDPQDPVAARRGVSSAFPWMVDFRVRTSTPGPLAAHQAVEYLAHDVVGEAIGFALFGSRSQEVARVDQALDVPMDVAETIALLALRYAHLIESRLEGDQKARYAGALRNVQANVVDSLSAQRSDSRTPLPAPVGALAFDLADPSAEAPRPAPAMHLAKDEAVVVLTVLLGQNIILPYEIDVAVENRRAAMAELTAEMGLGSVFGEDVYAAAKESQTVLGGTRTVNWLRWGAFAGGAVALVVATGGLALAAGAGLAGAAAITSALAAFGPGGMVGGLLTAGTLVTAGGGGIALGLASGGTSAAALEAVVAGQLTAEIVRNRHNLDTGGAVWRNLVEMEIELRREYGRLDEFSDASAASVKELRRKIETVERAIRHLLELGRGPHGVGDVSDDPKEDSPLGGWYRKFSRDR